MVRVNTFFLVSSKQVELHVHFNLHTPGKLLGNNFVLFWHTNDFKLELDVNMDLVF